MSENAPEVPDLDDAPITDPMGSHQEPVVSTDVRAATDSEQRTGGISDDPDVLRAEITRLRRENGAARTNAKAKAADDARAEFAQQIGKILGLVDDDAADVDPKILTEQLTSSQEAARTAQIELAVFRAAATTDADPTALLDSRSFLAKVADIDPADSDALQQAITDTLGSNPRLGKAHPSGMKPNPAQGRSASPPLGMADQIVAAQKAGDIKTVMRLKASMAVANGDHSTS